MKSERLDVLVWAAVYGGMVLVMLGLWSMAGAGLLGHLLTWSGALLFSLGIVMIWRRSRRGPADADDAAEHRP